MNAPAATKTLTNPWSPEASIPPTVPLVFLVQKQQGKWLRVSLPTPPNGSSAWIKNSDVTVRQNPYCIRVEVAAHRITVFNRARVLLEESVGTGTPATPTPTGVYYLVVLVKAPDPNTPAGPYVYGLSAYNQAGQELGLQGNNDPSLLGASRGMRGGIQMSNAGITRLAGLLPLGTPLQINP